MEIVLLLPNIRSTYNVGSIFRTADGLNVNQMIFSGITPYPDLNIVGLKDSRLPHIREKITNQIHKTALGAENFIDFKYYDILPIAELRSQGYEIVGLEQSKNSIYLQNFKPRSNKIALMVGEEVFGLTAEEIKQCDTLIEIPMSGEKESFNVSVATGICLYALTSERHSQIQ